MLLFSPLQQTELASPPSDSVSAVKFCPTVSSAPLLLSTSWDCTARLHDADANALLACIPHPSPLLDACWSPSPSTAFTASFDGAIHSVDVPSSTLTALPSPHTDGVRCLAFHAPTGLLVSAGWDGLVATTDLRSSSAPSPPSKLPSSLYSLSVDPHSSLMAVAGSGQALYLYDLRHPAKPTLTRASSLAHQTRCIRLLPSTPSSPSLGFALSTLSGRVAIDFFAPSAAHVAFAFKAHRTAASDSTHQTAHPVHALAFHPQHGTLATGGSDGTVAVWDVAARKRLGAAWTAGGEQMGVVALDWSADGERLAVGCAYGWEWGEDITKCSAGSRVVVRRMGEAEVRPKGK